MNIGLIGSGGREHALCKKLFDSKLTNQILYLLLLKWLIEEEKIKL